MRLKRAERARWRLIAGAHYDGQFPPWLVCGSNVLLQLLGRAGIPPEEMYCGGSTGLRYWHPWDRVSAQFGNCSATIWNRANYLSMRARSNKLDYEEQLGSGRLRIYRAQLPQTLLPHLRGRQLREVIDLRTTFPALESVRIKRIENGIGRRQGSLSILLQLEWSTLALMPDEIADAHNLPRQRSLDQISWLDPATSSTLSA